MIDRMYQKYKTKAALQAALAKLLGRKASQATNQISASRTAYDDEPCADRLFSAQPHVRHASQTLLATKRASASHHTRSRHA